MIQLPTNPDTYYFLAASGERHRLLPAHHSLAHREHATTSVDHGVDDDPLWHELAPHGGSSFESGPAAVRGRDQPRAHDAHGQHAALRRLGLRRQGLARLVPLGHLASALRVPFCCVFVQLFYCPGDFCVFVGRRVVWL